MIKLNRTTEYGLIALRHMVLKRAQNNASVTSAREVADGYQLPFEITAKTLQRLKDTGLIQSEQGARGGYTLARELGEVSLGEFLEMMEGPQSVVGCTTPQALQGACSCEYQVKCEMKGVMNDLNGKVKNFLHGIRLTDLTDLIPSAGSMGLTSGLAKNDATATEMASGVSSV